ncbi:MAG: CheR family methyltransferase [Bacteroidota bacterium]
MATLRGDRLRDDPAFPILKEAVIALTGLAYWRDKDEMLADLLAAVLERRREPAATLLQRLQVELGRGPASEAVVDAVTVGETFFFRYQAQFDALERRVIPDVLARNQFNRSLALWSAGCSNGAEAYSLSMLLRRRFAAPLAGWRLDILGTDISIAALAEAHAGEYGAWTIRDLPEDLRQDGFVVHGQRWRVKARFRHDVRFIRHNLVSQLPPGDGFDVVLCRNVLMYFDAPTRLRVLRHLSAAVAPGGWLLVGHAEVGPPVSDFFRPVVLPDCTLYQRPPLTAEAWG